VQQLLLLLPQEKLHDLLLLLLLLVGLAAVRCGSVIRPCALAPAGFLGGLLLLHLLCRCCGL
jgi:hypothetical protein